MFWRYLMPITEEVRTKLYATAKLLRAVAQPLGSACFLWDTIFDYEALARGERTLASAENLLDRLDRDYAYYGRS